MQMKRCKKVAALAAAIAVIMVCAVSPTFSYLTAKSDPVVNTFAGGSIAITIDEAQVDTDGKKLDPEKRVDENIYKYTAGAVLDKDPTPSVLKGSDSCYVFVYVKNGLNDLFTMNYQTDSWKKVASTDEGELYIYSTVVDASEAEENVRLNPIFTTVTVSKDLTQADITALGEATMEITSYAVQSAGVTSKDAIDIAIAQFAEGATPTYVEVN